MKVTLIGIDLAKTIFQVCGVNQAGKPVFNRTIRRAGLLSFVSRPIYCRQVARRYLAMQWAEWRALDARIAELEEDIKAQVKQG